MRPSKWWCLAPCVFTVGCAVGSEDAIARHDAAVDAPGGEVVGEAAAGDTADGASGDADTGLVDAGPLETGLTDGGADSTVLDAGPDTGLLDGAPLDTGSLDTGSLDTGPLDTGPLDTGPLDTGPLDTGPLDTGPLDTGPLDTGPLDTGADTGGTCPKALSLGAFAVDAEGWAFDPLWRWYASTASMVAGSTIKYSSSYTQNLTNPANVDLAACTTATLAYQVRLADDPSYASKGPDKSERLYVQCSGDGGATWTNLTPATWPTNQSACATSYCCGGPSLDRSFPLTAQTVTLPSTCRTATARFRFQAKGSSVWNLQNPGWYVDAVVLN